MTERTLILLRHAKAANPAQVADRDRPLTARGHADAAAAGAWLRARGLNPALVLCSPSRRTRETWHGVQVALGEEADTTGVDYEPALYESGARTILGLIQETGSDVDVLMLVGHNPTVSVLSAMLDPGPDTDADLRTAGLAVHRVDGTWTDCVPDSAPRTATHTARGS
jgi:phosphohistidine phosphatase